MLFERPNLCRLTEEDRHLRISCRRDYVAALRHKRLVRPDRCEKCGTKPEYTIEGHHEDYNKPLDVMWLCRPCHARRHSERRDKGPRPGTGYMRKMRLNREAREAQARKDAQ
jgi:hypothetical protein